MCSLANIETGVCETIVNVKELLSILLTCLDQGDVGSHSFTQSLSTTVLYHHHYCCYIIGDRVLPCSPN